MQNLQENVIRNYRSTFPDDSLTQVSHRTGIQITRVFRLLNGSEMKIKEYQAFKACLTKEKSEDLFLEVAHKCHQILTPKKVKELIYKMHFELKKASVTSHKISSTHEALIF